MSENTAEKTHIALACIIRRRWLRWRTHVPFWRDDKVAQALGIAQYGCPRCGHGSIEERDASPEHPRATLPPLHGGYRAGEPKADTRPAPPSPPHTCHHYGRGEDCWDDDCDSCVDCPGSFPCGPRVALITPTPTTTTPEATAVAETRQA